MSVLRPVLSKTFLGVAFLKFLPDFVSSAAARSGHGQRATRGDAHAFVPGWSLVWSGHHCSKTGGHPRTTLDRAIGSIWMALGISIFVLCFAFGLMGRLTDRHLFVSVISAIVGMANGASTLILRWKIQLGCAVVWWTAAVATCFGSDPQSIIVLLVAIFLCQIVFGIYGMIADAQGRKRQAPLHA